MPILKLYYLRSRCKETEGHYIVLNIENLCIAVILRIHSTKLGIRIKHRLSGLSPVIFLKDSGHSKPLSVFESTYLNFWIFVYLLPSKNPLLFACRISLVNLLGHL